MGDKKKKVGQIDIEEFTGKPDNPPRPATTAPAPEVITTEGPQVWEQVNIRTPEGFKVHFRGWCLRHNMSMGEALAEGYELLKKKHGA